MTGARPKVSVAMSAYNAEATIEQAVGSILWQTFQDWELLITNDGSVDDTAAILAELDDPRIRVLGGEDNRGKSRRMNEMIDAARAPLFAIMDADDISLPDRLEKQVRYLAQNPDVDLLAAGMATFDHGGHLGRWRRLRTKHEEIVRHPWLGFHFNSPTWVGRTGWFRRHKYREDLRAAEDEDLLLRSYETSTFAALPEFLLAYRIDLWSWAKARRMRRDHVRALLAAAVRRRSAMPIAGSVVHGVKLLREAIAVSTGLESSVLGHRALDLPRLEEDRIAALLGRLSAGRP